MKNSVLRRVNLKLDENLHAALRHQCVESNQSMQQILIILIQKYLCEMKIEKIKRT